MYGCIWIRAVIAEPSASSRCCFSARLSAHSPCLKITMAQSLRDTQSKRGWCTQLGAGAVMGRALKIKDSDVLHRGKIQEYKSNLSTRGGSIVNLICPSETLFSWMHHWPLVIAIWSGAPQELRGYEWEKLIFWACEPRRKGLWSWQGSPWNYCV